MKIALLSDGIFPFVLGGMQKHSYYLAKYFAHARVYVDLYFTYPDSLELRPDERGMFTDEELRFIKMTPICKSTEYTFPGHYVWESYRDSEQLWEALKENLDVDFIYAQGFAGWKTMQVKRKRVKHQQHNIPMVGVNFHGFEMWQMPASARVQIEQWLLRPFVKANIQLADVVLLLGEKLMPLVDAFMGYKKPTLASANGVTQDWMSAVHKARSNRLKFIFLGRYERRKGIEELHDTIQKLSPNFDFSFDIIGPIPDHLRIQSDKVKYWGILQDEAQIQTILKLGDVLVCPSYAEGMPTVILEAMASGLAVIATNVGAVGDLVSEANGWIIPPGHREALQGAMIEAITGTEDALSRKMAASHTKVRQEYLWHRVAAKTIQGIQSVL